MVKHSIITEQLCVNKFMKNSDGCTILVHLSVNTLLHSRSTLIVASFYLIRQVAPLYVTDTVNRIMLSYLGLPITANHKFNYY